MAKAASRRAAVPASFFVKVILPFAVPFALTLALMVLVGERWPRDIAPGSGLKLAGLVASALTAALVWRYTVRAIEDRRVHKAAGILCLVTGLMGWAVWTTGVLPSINGAALGSESTVRMRLERTEVTAVSKSKERYHWAWLRTDLNDAALASGRYFIPEGHYQRWQASKPASVEVTYARGLLGAQVVTGFR
ncbi:hypothetical protein [Novosphingobium sp. TH158]|uniref:hypothetical protein n=1 Tax=Novosphingobium sp. TH158 TaxID=2067455 RepID=UPI000C7AEF30|nr:hypothetical protein [Novosphingobium sp. TH158]PLK23997.1 hypothetical protein C0V78_14660 [Novosphingobium sp. TH158]